MVAAETRFTDRTDYEQRRYDRARTSRPRPAQQRAAGEFATGELDLDAQPDQETAQLIADFGHVMASANVLMAEYEDFTEASRLFVDVLIGLAGDRTNWFEANDRLIAMRAGRTEKWVQRTRKDFMAWQKKRHTSYVDISDHVYDPQNGNKPHQYRVFVSHIAAAATLDARASREYAANPGKALASSTNNLRSMLPAPTHRRRRPERPADAEKQIKRALKHIGTLMLRVEEIQSATGGRVELDLGTIEDLEKRLAVLKAVALDPLSTISKEKIVDINRARRAAAPVHPDLPGNSRAQDLEAQIDEFTDEQQDEYEAAVDEARQHNIDKGMPPQDAYRDALTALGNIDKFFAHRGGGHDVHSPQATATVSTISPHSALTCEPDESDLPPSEPDFFAEMPDAQPVEGGENLEVLYIAAQERIYRRKLAEGKPDLVAVREAREEVRQFEEFKELWPRKDDRR